jgi:hypothetical protein
MISPGRLWWLLRRDLKRGWGATYHDYRTRPRIAEWTCPSWNQVPLTTPVHVLTSENDWELGAWMLASLFHFSQQTWPVVIHDDGTLSESARVALRKLMPSARVVGREEADAAMEKVLAPFPFCRDYRKKHPLALKIFDIANICDADRFLILDSDVLFFKNPHEIVDWAKGSDETCWFNEDVAEGALITAQQAKDTLGITLWERVNSGLCLLTKKAVDLELCERALAQTDILRGHIWRVEQTLLALCASRHGKGGLLPGTYEVSLGRHASRDCIARHYVGAVRDRFFAEGLSRLHDRLLAAGTN